MTITTAIFCHLFIFRGSARLVSACSGALRNDERFTSRVGSWGGDVDDGALCQFDSPHHRGGVPIFGRGVYVEDALDVVVLDMNGP